ncbi:hypothetical protein EXVG_00344 [Emiliania huxleyi virus 202]|nr:hypothetical protein EXVG_00344 [Emiliania huxleyi virus 202]
MSHPSVRTDSIDRICPEIVASPFEMEVTTSVPRNTSPLLDAPVGAAAPDNTINRCGSPCIFVATVTGNLGVDGSFHVAVDVSRIA